MSIDSTFQSCLQLVGASGGIAMSDILGPSITLTHHSQATGKLADSSPFCIEFDTVISLVPLQVYGDVWILRRVFCLSKHMFDWLIFITFSDVK